MKIRIFGTWGLKVSLASMLSVANGLAQNEPPPIPETPSAPQEEQANSQPVLAVPGPESTNTIDIADAPTRMLTAEKTVPPSIRPGRPVAEIIKLANSGVEQGVMMAYITNSISAFNLSAEEIIYLKDIGVPDPMVTAMMLRDQALRVESANSLAAAAPQPAPGEPGVAPSASEVALQPDASAPAYPL